MRSLGILGVLILASCEFPRPADVAEDPCVGAICECTAATQDADCGVHQVCDESGPGRTCKCAPAYADKGAGCVFAGAPRDPGFMDPTAWTPFGDGASVKATAAGPIDPGLAVITPNGMCTGAGLMQTFVMPPLSKAEPLKASVTFGIANPAPGVFVGGGFTGQVNVEVGGRFFADGLVSPNSYHTASFCLGDSDYGRPVNIRIMTLGGPTTCPSSLPGAFTIDQFVVQPAATNECPPPGIVTNGDFEGTGGWAFTAVQGATTMILGNVGESSSRAAQLTTTTRCSEASLAGMVAIPARIANPAIDLYYGSPSGRADGRLTVSLDGKHVSVLPARDTPGHSHICLPKWAIGTTGELRFLLQPDAVGTGVSGNACTTPLAKTWTIDSVRIVSQATCGAIGDNTDPGFERIAIATGATVGWGLTDGFIGDLKGASAAIVSSRSDAHTGAGVLQLAATSPCASEAGADLSFVVPSAQGAAGPALKLFANIGTTNVNSKTTVTIGASATSGTTVSVYAEVRFTIPAQVGYAQHIVCIPKRLSNRLLTARFSTQAVGGDCLAPFPEERAFIDDVELTTDPSCTQ